MKQLDLANEKVRKLLRSFAVPCVISLLVAALYNIVDQIYIGHISGIDPVSGRSISILCNGATNVVYPFTLIALALCLLVGDGSAAMFSLCRGKGDYETAEKSIGNGFLMQITLLVLLTAAGFIFKDSLLTLFGATPAGRPYAEAYYDIIILGFPAYMFAQGMNSAIRADGSPRFAMAATTVGAVFNIILDPIFIFTFDMGIKGAAIATVIGQYVTFLLTVGYLFKSKNFHLSKRSIKPEPALCGRIFLLGISSLITQLSIVIIITVCNNLVGRINDPVYGTDISLAVIGIVMKVFGIVVSVCIGIALGGQPIVGFNYGAGNFGRVRETYKKIMLSCTAVGIAATVIFQLFPDVVVDLFGRGNGDIYIKYARLCLRIYLVTVLLTCLIKASSIFLQSIGASFKSMAVSVARDVIFFVPAITAIGLCTGSVKHMLWAAAVTDVLTGILTFVFIRNEFKKLNKTNNLPVDKSSVE